MLPGIRAIAFSVVLLPPVSFFQSAPQPGLLKIMSNPPGANVTIRMVNDNSKPAEAITNVTLVVTPGQYQVTAKRGSTSLHCTPMPATVNSSQATEVDCN